MNTLKRIGLAFALSAGGLLILLNTVYAHRMQASELLIEPNPFPVFPIEQLAAKQTVITAPTSAGLSFGRTLVGGDFNGDGADDLLVGIPGGTSDEPDRGAVQLFAGPILAGSEFTPPEHVALTLQDRPGASSAFGYYLRSGDMNGDGYDDVVVATASQTTFVFPGSPTITATAPSTITVGSKGAAMTVLGAGDGIAVCDINGDQYDDLFLGTLDADKVPFHYTVWGIFGRESVTTTLPITVDVSSGGADIAIVGITPQSWIRPSDNLACGDVDGDGYQDLVVGAFGETVGDRVSAGRVYVMAGSPSLTASQTISLPEQAGAILEGVDGALPQNGIGDALGESITVADLDGDGRADILMNALGAGPSNMLERAGEVWMWRGRTFSHQRVRIDEEAAWMLHGSESGALFGDSIVAADVRRDGRPELIVGCQNCKTGAATAGAIYVFDTQIPPGTWAADNGYVLKLSTESNPPNIGTVVNALDFDNDGAKDIALWASGYGFTITQPSHVHIVSMPLTLYLPALSLFPHPPFSATVSVGSNVRGCPSTICPIVDGLTPGLTLTVVACSESCVWYQIEEGGWVLGALVRPIP